MNYIIIKNLLIKLTKDRQGNVALMTFLMLSTVLTIALTTSTLVIQGISMGRTQTKSTKAFFAAEAGAERALWEIRINNVLNIATCDDDDCFSFIGGVVQDCDTNCANASTIQSLSNNSEFIIKYRDNAGGCTMDHCFDAIGAFSENKRSVEVDFCETGSANPNCP